MQNKKKIKVFVHVVGQAEGLLTEKICYSTTVYIKQFVVVGRRLETVRAFNYFPAMTVLETIIFLRPVEKDEERRKRIASYPFQLPFYQTLCQPSRTTYTKICQIVICQNLQFFLW